MPDGIVYGLNLSLYLIVSKSDLGQESISSHLRQLSIIIAINNSS